MKNLLLTSALAALLASAGQLNAQVKKAVPKAKTPLAVAKGPVLNKIDFFNLAPEDALQALNDELKKVKVVLKDIVEEPSYYYDISGKQLNLRSTSRKLVFDHDLTANITADENDRITAVSFSVGDGNVERLKAVKKVLVFGNWPVISLADNDTTYRNGNKVANSSVFVHEDDKGKITGRSFDVGIKQVKPYNYMPKDYRSFDPQNLDVHDNSDDIGYAIAEFMKKSGINLLYKDENLPFVIEDELFSYSCKYNFSNAVSVSINTSVSGKLKNIYIDSSDPITFSRLKKGLGILQWPETERDEYDESDADYYKFKNVVATVSSYAKDIVLKVHPLPEDIATRLENTFTPSFDELVDLYKSGTPEEVAKAITDTYVNQIGIDKTTKKMVANPNGSKFDFCFKTPGGSTAECYFNYNALANNKSTEVFLMSEDKAFVKSIYEQYLKSSSKSRYYVMLRLDGKDVTYPNEFDRVWFMNKEARDKEIADQQRQEAELAARKEQERLEAIEREKQRAARSMETLNKLGEFLLNSGKKQ